MFSVASLLVAASLGAGAFAQTLTINTPANVVQCEPILLQWSGGTPPYFLSVLPGNNPGAPALIDFGQQTGTTYSWPAVNETAGTSLGLTLRDSTGATANSAAFPVLSSSDSSCLGGGAASGGSSTTSGASAPAGSTTTTTTPVGTTTTTGPATTPTTPTSTKSTTTAPATTPKSSSTAPATSSSTGSGAMPTGAAQVGLAGFVGAVLAAALV